MAQLIIDIPGTTAEVNRILDAFTKHHGYKAMIQDPNNPLQTIPNPQTKAQFAKAVVARFVKQCVIAQEATDAAEVARQAAVADAETVVVT